MSAEGIQGGLAGLYLSNAHSHFDEVVVSNYLVDDFRDGDAGGWSRSAGEWAVQDPVQGVYSGQHTTSALSLWAQTMTAGSGPAFLRFTARPGGGPGQSHLGSRCSAPVLGQTC